MWGFELEILSPKQICIGFHCEMQEWIEDETDEEYEMLKITIGLLLINFNFYYR